jgi:hypothetical protein
VTSSSHAQITIFSFCEYEHSAKNPLTRAIGYNILVENFFLKNGKMNGGHHAPGST